MPQIADKPATSEPGTDRVQPSVSAIIAKRCADRAAELNDGSLRARLDIATEMTGITFQVILDTMLSGGEGIDVPVAAALGGFLDGLELVLEDRLGVVKQAADERGFAVIDGAGGGEAK